MKSSSALSGIPPRKTSRVRQRRRRLSRNSLAEQILDREQARRQEHFSAELGKREKEQIVAGKHGSDPAGYGRPEGNKESQIEVTADSRDQQAQHEEPIMGSRTDMEEKKRESADRTAAIAGLLRVGGRTPGRGPRAGRLFRGSINSAARENWVQRKNRPHRIQRFRKFKGGGLTGPCAVGHDARGFLRAIKQIFVSPEDGEKTKVQDGEEERDCAEAFASGHFPDRIHERVHTLQSVPNFSG